MPFDASVLSYLAGVAVRSLCLLLLALLAIAVLRVRTAAARHAVWTAVTVGMLLLAVLAPLAPPIPLRVLAGSSAESIDVGTPVAHVAGIRPPAAPRPAEPVFRLPTWTQTAIGLYLIAAAVLLTRLAFGYLFTRRLVKASIRTELGPEPVLESTWISVPLTVGWARPKILLPAGWRQWDRAKLAAVMAHERTHVRRADWGIALLAGVNRCLFWFHPLAWWLEQHLAALAEHACDDSALLEMESREPYAQALLDMAAAVRTVRGRLVWEAMAMAKASEVKMRIERILDETRQIPRGVTRRRWAALVVCSLPLIYAASVVQLAPAQAQVQERRAVPPTEVSQLSTADVARMEQQLVSNPDDLESRSKLIAYYFLNSIREPRLTHILWMIENHPESELTAFNSSGISPRANSLNTVADYQRAASLWQQQVAIHPKDQNVLANAAQFYAQRGGDWDEAERLLMQSGNTTKLAALYSKALTVSTDSSGALHFPALDENNAFANKVIGTIERSTDPMFILAMASNLRSVPPTADEQLRRTLQPRIELGNRLFAKAQELGGPNFRTTLTNTNARETVVRANPEPKAPAAAAVKAAQLETAPQVLSKVDPEYPPQARQARIESDIHLEVAIDTGGRPTDIRVVSGHPLMIKNTLEAVKQWIFATVLQNGVPVAARFPLTVPFRLDGGNAPLPQANPAAPAIPSRIRIGGNVQMAQLVQQFPATYPEQARTAGPDGGPLEGVVKLNVIIGKDGHVLNVSPAEGHPLLAAAATDAVKQWIYRPTLLNGQPVEVATTVDVPFSAK